MDTPAYLYVSASYPVNRLEPSQILGKEPFGQGPLQFSHVDKSDIAVEIGVPANYGD